MLTTIPSRSTGVNANYNILGQYVQDDSRIPYFNAISPATMIEPGEPVTVGWGAGLMVALSQSAIMPNEVGVLCRYWIADLPCVLSANVLVGAELYWDFTAKVVKLGADVTNGFIVGHAIWAIDPQIKGKAPALTGAKVIAGTTASTRIRVVGLQIATTPKGVIVSL